MEFLNDPIGAISKWATGLLASIGLPGELIQFLLYFVGAMIMVAGAMFFCILLIWAERKVGGRLQDRIGPNRLGPFGLIQPFADMFKIFTKEYITPAGVDWLPYNLGPVLAVGSVLMLWAVIPFAVTIYGVDLNVGILYLLAVGALGELAVVLSGWGSNNKFALVGAFRAVAVLISYEVPMLVSLLVPVMLAGSMNIQDIVKAQPLWFIVLAPAAALLYFITSIAENARAPFDLVEADSEIVAGFNIEYSGLKFGMFFVGDFLHAYTAAMLFTTLFLGGWSGPFAGQFPLLGVVYFFMKATVMYLIGLVIRFSLPRFRIDQMMAINWKLLTPLSLTVVSVFAITDKLLPPGLNLIRIAGLIIVNLAVLFAADRLTIWYTRRKSRVVVSKPVEVKWATKVVSPESGGKP